MISIMNAYLHTSIQTRTHTHTHTHTHTYTYIHTHLHIAYVQAYKHAHIRSHTYTNILSYAHIHRETRRTVTHKQTDKQYDDWRRGVPQHGGWTNDNICERGVRPVRGI